MPAHATHDRARAHGRTPLRASLRALGRTLQGALVAVVASWLLLAASAQAADPWTPQGGVMNISTATEVTETATAVSGTTPHVAFLEGGNVYVKRWNGASWVQNGASRLNTTAGAAKSVDAVADASNVYVAWHETVGGFDNLFVSRWNGASWTALGGSLNISTTKNGIDPSIALVGGTLTVAWKEDTTNNDIYVKQWNGSSWVSVGGAVEPTPAQWVYGVAVTGNASNLYVVVGNWDGTNYDIYVRRWNGSAWTTVGGGPLNIDANRWSYRADAIMQGANLVVSWAEDDATNGCCQIYVKQWNGSAWSQLAGTSGTIPGGESWSWEHDLIAGPTGPMLALRVVRTPYTVSVIGWTGTDWKHYGGVVNQDHREAGQASIGLVSGVPWVSFAEDDAGGVGQLRSLKWNPTNTMVGNITNFTASPTSGQIAFTWTNPPDVDYTGVEIWRSTTDGTLGTLVQTVAAPGTSWTDTGRTNGQRLYYTFITKNSLGDRRNTSYETADSSLLPAAYAAAIEGDGSDVYAFGGVDAATSSQRTSIWKFAPTTGLTSLRSAALPAAGSDMRAVWVGGSVNRVILLGGDYGGASTSIRRYDPGADLLVTAGASLPAARSSGGAAYSPATGRIYYLGGASQRWTGGTIYNTIYWYDPATDTSGDTGAVLPQPMYRMTATYWPGDQCIYMFGGKTTGDVDSNRIVKYCPATNTASNLAVTMPTAVSEMTSTQTSRGIMVFGGSGASYQQLVNEFDPFERAFVTHPVLLPFAQFTNSVRVATDDIIYSASTWAPGHKITQTNVGVHVDATASTPPATPTNVTPASGAVVATATPTLTASAFSDPNGDAQQASHWQLRSFAGTYTTPVFDSGLDFSNLTSIPVTSLSDGRYCWRVRYRDVNRVWSPFSSETCFWVDVVAQNPVAAATLEQYRANGTTVIPSGGYTTDGVSTNVVLQFDMSDPDGSQTLTPWVEVRPGATAFSTACGTSVFGVTFSGTAIALPNPDAVVTATVNVTGLAAGTTYRWRACARDNTARSGAYTNKGASPDFRVVVDQLPTATPSTPNAGATWSDTTPNLVATFTDPDAPDTGTIDVEVCTSNPTPAQSCTGIGGTLSASGATSSGIVNGSTGTWTVSPALALGSYWWRVRARDQYDLEGAWSAGRQLIIGTPSLTIGVDSATQNLGTLTAGTDATGTTTLTIASNNASGYALSATDASDTGASTCSSGGCTGLWIPDWTGTGATPTTWAAGSSGAGGWFGLTVLSVTGTTTTKLAKWGTGATATDFVNNKYAGLKTTASTLHTTGSYFSGSDTITTAYRANPSTTTVAGTYSATISYSVVANP